MITDERCQYDAWIASAGIPPVKLKSMLDFYGDSESCFHVFTQNPKEFMENLTPRICYLLKENSSSENMKKLKKQMEQHSIRVMLYTDPLYPKMLSEIDDSPAVLFYQGNPECLKRKILAMVGSRAASYSGQRAARKISEELSRHHVSVISGLASGIDACAHQGCIDGGSPTIAVTGGGLDKTYPAENTKLRDRILEQQGLILSEYIPGEKPAGWHFPFRNRIITGISYALILMEAKIKSGSMTSVQHALEQGKEVFVYPGEPDSLYFEGNHQLLREGGIFFTSAEDILEDLRWLDNPRSVRQNNRCSTDMDGTSPEEKAILVALGKGILSFEQLLNATGMAPSALMSNLTILQIRGQAEALPGKLYQLKH